MPIDRRHLMAAGGAGLGLAGLAAAARGAPPAGGERRPAFHGSTVQLVPGSPTPQTKAIQNAIDDASAAGRPVLLPPGRFLTGQLQLHPTTRLIGAHGQSELVAATPEPLIIGVDAGDILIADLAIDGAEKASRLIQLERCGGRISACTLRNAADAAVFSNDSSGLTVDGNRISNCANNGIQIWRSQAGPDGSQVLANRISRIESRSGGTGQNGNGINVFRAGGVMVSGNVIEDCAYSAVRGNSASNLQILDNQCARLGEVALYAEFGFEGAIISRNVVDGAATGIAVTNFNDGGRLAIVEGNLVRNLKKRPWEPVDKRGEGISVEADTIVTSNVVESAESYGILVGWGPHMRNVIVTSNIVRLADIGIGLTADTDGGTAVITDNVIDGAKRGAIRGFHFGRIVGADLALEETRTARIRISGNMKVGGA